MYLELTRLSIDDSNIADDEDTAHYTPLSSSKDEYPSIIPVTSPTTPPSFSNENISESIIQLHQGREHGAAGKSSVVSMASFAVDKESKELKARQREVSITEINEPLENIEENELRQSLNSNSVQPMCHIGATDNTDNGDKCNGSIITEVNCPLENLSETMSPVSSGLSMKIDALTPSTTNADPPTDPPIEEDPPTDPLIEEDPPTDPPIEEDPPTDPPIEEGPPIDPPTEGDPPTDPPVEDDPPSEDESPLSKTPVRKPPLHVDQSNNGECTLQKCLRDFVSSETLRGNDKFLCEVCTENAKKEKLKSSSHNSTPVQVPSVLQCDKKDKASYSATKACNNDHAHNIGKLQTVHEAGKDDVSSLSSSTEEDDEDTEMVESTKESDGRRVCLCVSLSNFHIQ